MRVSVHQNFLEKMVLNYVTIVMLRTIHVKKQAQVQFVTSQKRIMTSFKLNISQKMLRYRKVIWANLEIEKLPVTVATWILQELFVNKFDSKPS